MGRRAEDGLPVSAPAPAPGRPAGGGSLLTQRMGPLATWVWLVILTVVIAGIALYMRRKSGSAASSASTGQAAPGQTAGVQQVPNIILQDYSGSGPPVTPPSQPSPTGAAAAPPAAAAAPPASTTAPPAAAPAPPAAAAPAKPAAPKYTTVTVAKWTATDAPWNSTLSGIAAHYHVTGGYQALAKLNGIKNPNLIYPGQTIRVPA
jgi:LysM repeat protein